MAKAGNPRWVKGQSGNPGGRPKGLATSIREKYGEDGATLIAQLHRVAFSRSRKMSTRDRLTAIEMLLDRGWGKAAQVIAGDADNPLALKVTFGGRYKPEAPK